MNRAQTYNQLSQSSLEGGGGGYNHSFHPNNQAFGTIPSNVSGTLFASESTYGRRLISPQNKSIGFNLNSRISPSRILVQDSDQRKNQPQFSLDQSSFFASKQLNPSSTQQQLQKQQNLSFLLNTTESERGDKKRELTFLEKQLDEKEREKSDLHERIDRLQRDNSLMQQQIIQMGDTIQNLEKASNSLVNQYLTQNKKNDLELKQVDELIKANAQLRKNLEIVEQKNIQLDRMVEVTNQKSKNESQQNPELKKRVVQLEENLASNEEILRQARQIIEDLKKKNSQSESHLQQDEETIIKFQQLNAEKEDELRRIKREADQQISILREKEKVLKQQAVEREQVISRLQDRLVDNQRGLVTESENKALKNELESLRERKRDLESDFHSLHGQISELHTQIADLRRQNSIIQKQHSFSEMERDKLERCLIPYQQIEKKLGLQREEVVLMMEKLPMAEEELKNIVGQNNNLGQELAALTDEKWEQERTAREWKEKYEKIMGDVRAISEQLGRERSIQQESNRQQTSLIDQLQQQNQVFISNLETCRSSLLSKDNEIKQLQADLRLIKAKNDKLVEALTLYDRDRQRRKLSFDSQKRDSRNSSFIEEDDDIKRSYSQRLLEKALNLAKENENKIDRSLSHERANRKDGQRQPRSVEEFGTQKYVVDLKDSPVHSYRGSENRTSKVRTSHLKSDNNRTQTPQSQRSNQLKKSPSVGRKSTQTLQNSKNKSPVSRLKRSESLGRNITPKRTQSFERISSKRDESKIGVKNGSYADRQALNNKNRSSHNLSSIIRPRDQYFTGTDQLNRNDNLMGSYSTFQKKDNSYSNTQRPQYNDDFNEKENTPYSQSQILPPSKISKNSGNLKSSNYSREMTTRLDGGGRKQSLKKKTNHFTLDLNESGMLPSSRIPTGISQFSRINTDGHSRVNTDGYTRLNSDAFSQRNVDRGDRTMTIDLRESIDEKQRKYGRQRVMSSHVDKMKDYSECLLEKYIKRDSERNSSIYNSRFDSGDDHGSTNQNRLSHHNNNNNNNNNSSNNGKYYY